ncbi:MAG TPA: hypothetical protein VE954_11245 [Oligoflexus sp.]|uniref:hypothetical protein n=1 Tax=Oligoflexus sp. TaxID=1971216 RepID=UPI002D29AE3E|nr:hypothetical protein [Oligoflexus sp.]HYX33680.1 hypothetical protein [Oligoflexus sp.]
MRRLIPTSALVYLILQLAAGCSSKQDGRELQSPTAEAGIQTQTEAILEVPNLEIRSGVTLELVSGFNIGGSSCRNGQGELFKDYPVSDVVYRVQDGFLEKEENVGCPATIQKTRKVITEHGLSLAKAALLEIKRITVETREDCASDYNYVGVRVRGGPEGEKFVHIVPRSRGNCKGDFVTIVDWQQIKETFDLAFSL